MNKMSYVKKSIITAVCIALAVVLPMAFHSIPDAGRVILPMHIPVLLCGLVCGGAFGLLSGIAGPLVSHLVTGMPPAAYSPGMMIELAVYGLAAGFMMRLIRTGKVYVDLYISLVAALLAGRLAAGVCSAIIFSAGSYSMTMWVTSYFITALPGLIIQILVLPSLVFALEAARLIPARYPKQRQH